MTLASQVAVLLATKGLAAAQAAAAGSTDPDALRLIAHYQAAGCNPGMVQPMPPGMPAGSVWIYEPSGRDQCAFSSWSFKAGDAPPPLPEAAPTTYVLPSGVVVPPAAPPAPSGGTLPSFFSTIPTWAWWIGAGALAVKFLRR
jgi:hypothetical protein